MSAKRTTPFALKEACVLEICYQLLLDWGEYGGTSPIAYMPSNVVEDIFEVLGNWGIGLTLTHFQYLLVQPTRSITNREQRWEVPIRTVLDWASTHCQFLTVLELQGNNICEESFTSLSSFTRLEVLSLTDSTGVSDDILKKIGDHLHSLITLTLTGCQNVTDGGLIYLLMGPSQNHTSRCPSLKNLSLEGTRVGTYGLQLALRFRPGLENLVHQKTARALGWLDRSLPPHLARFTYNIEHLTLPLLDDIRENDLVACLRDSPTTKKFKIQYNECRMAENLMEQLMDRNIIVSLDFDMHITSQNTLFFFEEVLPFLRVHGHTLKFLKLSGMFSINFIAITILCTRLQTLTIEGVLHFDAPTGLTGDLPSDAMPELVELTIKCLGKPVIDNKILKYMVKPMIDNTNVTVILCPYMLRALDVAVNPPN